MMEQNAYIDSINPVSISSERSIDKNSETTAQEKRHSWSVWMDSRYDKT